MSYICDICNSVISNKYLLKKHKGTEYCQKIKKEKEYYDNIQNFNNKLQNLENKIFIYESQLNEKDIENKILKEKLKEYKIILEDIFNPVKNVNKTITNTKKLEIIVGKLLKLQIQRQRGCIKAINNNKQNTY